MKEYAAGKTTLDPWLGIKVSMKSGAGRQAGCRAAV